MHVIGALLMARPGRRGVGGGGGGVASSQRLTALPCPAPPTQQQQAPSGRQAARRVCLKPGNSHGTAVSWSAHPAGGWATGLVRGWSMQFPVERASELNFYTLHTPVMNSHLPSRACSRLAG